uniref:Uncharacterized protein n=1 Tax=Cannabis sativa TaxID=3483 RepID=A0A803PID7_CANSA
MAKTRAKQSKPKSPVMKKEKRGPDSSTDVKKTKSMDEILGIEPLIFSDDEDELEDQSHLEEGKSAQASVEMEAAVSPAQDLNDSIRRDAIRLDFAHLMEAKQF